MLPTPPKRTSWITVFRRLDLRGKIIVLVVALIVVPAVVSGTYNVTSGRLSPLPTCWPPGKESRFLRPYLDESPHEWWARGANESVKCQAAPSGQYPLSFPHYGSPTSSASTRAADAMDDLRAGGEEVADVGEEAFLRPEGDYTMRIFARRGNIIVVAAMEKEKGPDPEFPGRARRWLPDEARAGFARVAEARAAN